MTKTEENVAVEPWIGDFFHVYNRGVEKRRIFEEKGDYLRFLLSMAASNSSSKRRIHPSNLSHQGSTLVWITGQIPPEDHLVDIGAYCLMSNHFHLLVKERQERGLAKFMQRLITGYTMYFNTKNERTGALLQGRYKAKRVDSDEYLKYLFAYIHLNPVEIFQPSWKEDGIEDEIAAREFLLNYNFSSYLDYLGYERDEQSILHRQAFPSYFAQTNDFASLINDWLLFRPYGEAQGDNHLV